MPTPPSFHGLAPSFFDPLATQGTSVEPVSDIPAADPTKDSERFQILRLYARGGQGHVFVARDGQLGREVAVKELQPQYADRALSRARFVREAEITGSLEHPGVVPVYSLGHHAGGRPYYAMRLIQGRNLQLVIQEYHDPNSGLSPIERNLRYRQLLQRFVSVCQTIAYAHSRSIVHRDIKPSNVLIGSYGEAIVVDWGLARPYHVTQGCAFEPDVFPTIDGTPGPSTDIASTDSTMMGAALGTPAFMSPEQADGKWDIVGPATDIYALGATLYVILTGKAPLEQLAWPEMSKKIRTGDIRRPRELNPTAPRGLEAICRKAMAIEIGDRYSTALDLAQDVEHWLGDEPIAAYREPVRERVQRWSRRHRTLVAASAALCITAMVGLSWGLFAVNRQRSFTESAHDRTRKAYDQTISEIVGPLMDRLSELLPKDREFLRKTMAEYEEFARETRQDAASRAKVVQAYRHVGEIRLRLGDIDEAGEPLAQALVRCQTLADEYPDDDEMRDELARIHTALGTRHGKQGRNEDAEQAYAKAVAIREVFNAAKPNDDVTVSQLSDAYSNHAAALARLNRPPEAVEAFRKVLRIREQLAKMHPNSLDVQRELASSLNNLAKALLAVRQKALEPEAEQLLRRAMSIGDHLFKQSDALGYREELAAACSRLGLLMWMKKSADAAVRAQEVAEAKALIENAADHYERLSAINPSVRDYGTKLEDARRNLAMINDVTGNAPEAQEQFDKLIARLKLAQSAGKLTDRQRSLLSAAHAGRAKALDSQHRHAEAANAYSVAIELDPAKRSLWRSLRAYQHVKSGSIEAALIEANDLVQDPEVLGEILFNCACVFARASSVEPAQTEERARRAVELLQLAAQRGFFQRAERIEHMDKDEDGDLRSLRAREDYRKFRASLNH